MIHGSSESFKYYLFVEHTFRGRVFFATKDSLSFISLPNMSVSSHQKPIRHAIFHLRSAAVVIQYSRTVFIPACVARTVYEFIYCIQYTVYCMVPVVLPVVLYQLDRTAVVVAKWYIQHQALSLPPSACLLAPPHQSDRCCLYSMRAGSS